ncbi:MAG: hypothetical protein UT42_C0015G0003 [Candidatus Falkowbacteria bacterium GW2011_GWA2_39_24]|uniref:Uncharacterized protein n=1 Tax=Candidatus Falkowbacteria bacterium GW2011_GWA2_39_24 TaxID=1618634 RepID=A0A0G0QX37_9BACT|nr:MAG: hypothetical protein UT42_C0015G0003 [Candidatus Falkowbacteria bacterium GW2011_GWA2_39_24]
MAQRPSIIEFMDFCVTIHKNSNLSVVAKQQTVAEKLQHHFPNLTLSQILESKKLSELFGQ